MRSESVQFHTLTIVNVLVIGLVCNFVHLRASKKVKTVKTLRVGAHNMSKVQ